jgi:hypothetical protein
LGSPGSQSTPLTTGTVPTTTILVFVKDNSTVTLPTAASAGLGHVIYLLDAPPVVDGFVIDCAAGDAFANNDGTAPVTLSGMTNLYIVSDGVHHWFVQ